MKTVIGGVVAVHDVGGRMAVPLLTTGVEERPAKGPTPRPGSATPLRLAPREPVNPLLPIPVDLVRVRQMPA